MTRKRRLIQEAEANLALGVTPYWENLGNVEEDWDEDDDAAPNGRRRRSRRGTRSRHGEVSSVYG